MRISAAMMVRDEEENLPRCLESIKNLVDEIVVIDTGSTDRSAEISAEYGAKVFHEQWSHDFSLHRNQSISKTSGDWVLIIDADEKIVGKKKKAKKWLDRMPDDVNCAVLELRDMQEGEVYLSFNSPRIFRRGRVKYKNIVHNRAEFEGKAVYCPLISVTHYGYDLDEEGQDRKYHRTMGLLQTRLKQNPEDWQVYFYMAQLFPKKQKLKSALACCLTYVRHKEQIPVFNQSIWFTLLQLALKLADKETIEKYFRQALDALPYDIDVSWAVMEYGIMIKNPEIIAEGASRYVIAYDRLIAYPVEKQGRFVYCGSTKNLTLALYHLSLLRLNDGLRLLERLKALMPELPENYRESAQADLARELEKIGIKWIHKEAA
jgi:glycosyltransferase involved in cell wall biosynthesis